MNTSNSASSDSTTVVIVLLVIWVILALALVYFYRKLNKDTKGQYDVQRIIFAEGGLRERLRQGIGIVENRFNVRIWPQPRVEEEEDLQGNEGGGEEDVVNDNENESHAEEEEQDSDGVKDDSSDDYSSIDLRERAILKKEDKNMEKTEEEAEEDVEKQKEDAAGKDEKHSEELKNEEKVELLVDFKPFAGSAIWSEESKDEGNDMTAL